MEKKTDLGGLEALKNETVDLVRFLLSRTVDWFFGLN